MTLSSRSFLSSEYSLSRKRRLSAAGATRLGYGSFVGPALRDEQCDVCRTEANVSESRGYVIQVHHKKFTASPRRTVRRLSHRSKRLGEPWLRETGPPQKIHSLSETDSATFVAQKQTSRRAVAT